MDGGMEPKEATEKALNYMEKRTGETGGAIAISSKGQRLSSKRHCNNFNNYFVMYSGEIGLHFTSEHMPWAYVKNDQVHYGIDMNDDYIDHIDHQK